MRGNRRYLVAGGTAPVAFDTCAHGPLVDPGRYRTLTEANAEAEQLVAQGLRGVAIQELGAVVAIWPRCKAVAVATTLPSGRYWPTHFCGRHDLLDDGMCPEHSSGQPIPAEPVQLALLEGVAAP